MCATHLISGAENSDLAVPVNNTLVCRMSFLAADTWPCVLIKFTYANVNTLYYDSNDVDNNANI